MSSSSQKNIDIGRKRIYPSIYQLDIVEILATGIKRINESYKDFDLKPGFDINHPTIKEGN